MVYAKLNAVGAVTHIDQITTQQGCTLKQVVEDALREFFSHHRLERDPVCGQFPDLCTHRDTLASHWQIADESSGALLATSARTDCRIKPGRDCGAVSVDLHGDLRGPLARAVHSAP